MASNVTFIPNLLVGFQWEHSPEALAIVALKGEQTAANARRLCPVRTGALRESISVTVVGITATAAAQIVADEPYAAFVENGTSDTPAQPFMRPGLDAAMKGA